MNPSVEPASVLTDPGRLRQLQICRILDSPREEAFDRLTRLAAVAIDAPVALLTFVDAHRQWFKSSYGLSEPWATRRETPLSHSFCRLVVASGQPLIVADARQDPRVQENLAISELGVEAYLGAPLIDSDGSVLGSFAVIDDKPRGWTQHEIAIIQDLAALAMLEVQMRTEAAHRREAEEALRQSQKLEAVGRLAGGVAHDFNNVMLIIQGYAALLGEGITSPDPRAEYVSEINKAASRAAALTRQLLAFSRKQVLRAERVDLNAVISNVAPMLARTIGENIALHMSLQPELHPIEVDPHQLEQVIVNLVLNARDATSPSGTIVIRTQNTRWDAALLPPELADREQREWVELQVEDSGCGMEAEVLTHIFEPFYTTKPSGHGTGLGLATVHGVVRQSGGFVWAQSTVGRGSTFHVLLPKSEPQIAPVERPLAPAPVAAGAAVLVVEDDEKVRKLLALFLQRAGFRTIEAESGEQALGFIDAQSPHIDLALLDVVMPGMNGRELGSRLAQRMPRLKILYMSGYTDDHLLRHGVEHEHLDFLQKPISAGQLLAKIGEMLGQGTSGRSEGSLQSGAAL